MKKFCIVLTALLLTATAFGVDIWCDQPGGLGTDECAVHYDASGDAELPRAFALDITLDTGTIETLVSSDPCFWVHPGNIVIETGVVTNEGSPIAVQDTNYPGREEEGLGTDGITIEMGSLYDPNDPDHQDPPPDSGELLRITVDDAFLPIAVSIAENAARGGVVMEDASEDDPNITGCTMLAAIECYAGQPDYSEWVAAGKPTCWCYPRQCLGDADGLPFGKSNYWVTTPDLDILSAAWNQNNGPTTAPGSCADFDHLPFGKSNYRVTTPDLDILSLNWNQNNLPAPGCSPGTENP